MARTTSQQQINRSPEADAWRRLYSLQEWRRPGTGLRARQLTKQPLCERHLAEGRVVPADTVHHRVAHKGDLVLFRDPENLESVCGACHSGLVQAEEHGRVRQVLDDEGYPI